MKTAQEIMEEARKLREEANRHLNTINEQTPNERLEPLHDLSGGNGCDTDPESEFLLHPFECLMIAMGSFFVGTVVGGLIGYWIASLIHGQG